MMHRKTIRFLGTVSSGVGRHCEMTIPGRRALPNAPEDWPVELCPGSLNILIDVYPEGFTQPVGRSGGAYQLDEGSFEPAFIIPGDLITGNELIQEGRPADAQVWRARLQIADRAETVPCWVLRRIGSNVGKGKCGNVLEIVAEEHLRKRHHLQDGERVTLELVEG
jgi:hypothetical protein